MFKTLARTLQGVLIFVMLCALASTLHGCGVRTVYVPAGEPVRLRQSIKGCKVWVPDKTGTTELPSTLDIPEGWWALDYSTPAETQTQAHYFKDTPTKN
jgi:hypothetical protein